MTNANNNTSFEFLNTIAYLVYQASGTPGNNIKKISRTEALIHDAFHNLESPEYGLNETQLKAKAEFMRILEEEKEGGNKWSYSKSRMSAAAERIKDTYELKAA